MTWSTSFKKGVDPAVWDALAPHPSVSYNGGANVYDGSRYMYWLLQVGVTTTTASTTQLWQYDTYADGWAFLATCTASNQGADLEYDSIRNVLYIINGAATTTAQVYNLNLTSVTIANTACAARALTSILALPLASALGASLTMPDDLSSIGTLTANGATAIDGDAAITGTTTTSILTASTSLGIHMVGLYCRFTSGAQAGVRRLITGVSGGTLTVAALPGAPVAGDTFVIELPELVASGTNSTTSVQSLSAGWTTNQYRDMDVVFITGALAGQRRRIASNTADTLTLNAAVTGNSRTGALGGTPGTSDIFRIVTSSDFLYYAVGTTIYRLDVVQTTGAAWSASLATIPAALGGGSNSFYAGKYDPMGIFATRGGATSTVYHYDMGLRTWTTLTTYTGETFTTGAVACMVHGYRRIWVTKESTSRSYFLHVPTGVYEPGPTLPYAVPGAYDGKRARLVTSPDGVPYLYWLRAGGQEFYRVPVEWM